VPCHGTTDIENIDKHIPRADIFQTGEIVDARDGVVEASDDGVEGLCVLFLMTLFKELNRAASKLNFDSASLGDKDARDVASTQLSRNASVLSKELSTQNTYKHCLKTDAEMIE